MKFPTPLRDHRHWSNLGLSAALVFSLSACGGGPSRASIEKMLEQPEPNKVASNLDGLLKKLENPKRNIMPDSRCAMMTVAVELADRARALPLDEKTGAPFVPAEQFARLRTLLVNEIDAPGVYYNANALTKKGYNPDTVGNHLSSWATYELANSDFGGQEKLNKLLEILGNSRYAGYDLSWQRAAAFNVIQQIDLVKKSPALQLETLNRTLSARVIAGLPKENKNSYQAELDQLLSVIDSHILTLPLMNNSLKSLKNNSDTKLIVAAIRRNYRLLDRILDAGIHEATLQRHLYENIELLRFYAFEHADSDIHTYARNTLVRFAPFIYLDGVIALEDSTKKKLWVQETIQILPVMDAYMATVSPTMLEGFTLPSFTQAIAKLEGVDKERDALQRAKENAAIALDKMDADLEKANDDEPNLPERPSAPTEDEKLFLALENVSAQIINPTFYFPINTFNSKRQNFLDQTFGLLVTYPSAERKFLLSELYKQEPIQLLSYLSNNREAEFNAGQDYALQAMLILGNLSQDKRLAETQQEEARINAAWFLTQAYTSGDNRNLIEAGMQFIYQQHPLILANALHAGLAHFNTLNKEAAWDHAQAYTAALRQVILLTDPEKTGVRPEMWAKYLGGFTTIHDRWDFRPFTICLPFLLEEHPDTLLEIVLADKPLQRMASVKQTASNEPATTETPAKENPATEEVAADPFDPNTNHDLLIARALIVFDIMKRAKPKVSATQWDKAVEFMIAKFNASNSEELDHTLARGLIELDRDGKKASARVLSNITAKYPGFALVVADMDAPNMEGK